MFDPQTWAAVPFHFWSAVFFCLGSIVGSLLNVCIHRMPRGESIVSPPSHCPECGYAIPWYLNIPLFTWVYLRGQCANCRTSISPRYFIVELLTGIAFLGCWLAFGSVSAPLALVYCLVLSGFIVATFIDFEHFIIPDEITLGGTVAGFLGSAAVPLLHGATAPAPALRQSILGLATGAGVIYAILRIAKFFLGRQKLKLDPNTRLRFTETSLHLPDQEIPYEEMFYRKTDYIALEARTVELSDRSYFNVRIRLTPNSLQIGDETINPETVTFMEVVADHIIVPREAMGLGDVKFMAAIGAFLGWKAVVFSLTLSAFIGATVGIVLIALGKKAWSSRVPYGPYIAVAATVWIFAGERLVNLWFALVNWWWMKWLAPAGPVLR